MCRNYILTNITVLLSLIYLAYLLFSFTVPGEADRSPPSSAEVKNAWSYISTLPIRLPGVLLS
jgi:hypothetical protein